MSKITEVKNHCYNINSKINAEQSNSMNLVVAWNDKVGIRATESMKETINSWSNASRMGFQSVDIALTSLESMNAELESIKIQLSNINNCIEQENYRITK